MRDDIKGVQMAPKLVEEHLLRAGGMNEYGEPRYRLVLASSRYMQVAGEFQIWGDDVPMAERGGLVRTEVPRKTPKPIYAPQAVKSSTGREVIGYETTQQAMVPSERQPERVEVGLIEVPRYQVAGWILERYMPALAWGTRQEWEAKTLPDGTPLLGPYPERGEYDYAVGPWPEIPGMLVLSHAINYIEDQIENQRDSTAVRRAKRIAAAEDADAKRSQKFQADTAAFIRDKVSPMTSGSLVAGRVREEWARAAGIKSHVGN